MGSKTKQESKFTKYIKAPVRMLARARDLYVNSLNNCSGKMSYGTTMCAPSTGYMGTLPKSYSTNSNRSSNTDDDLRELIRAASQRGLREKIEKEIHQQRESSKRLPRSFTVGIQKIDEDETCDFGDVPKVKKIEALYPRSKSHAVSSKRTNLYA